MSVCWACVGGVGRVCCVCGACLGCVGSVCGACDVGAWGDVSGACEGVVERKYRSPLYYPDTLVNPDTCLGECIIRRFFIARVRIKV